MQINLKHQTTLLSTNGVDEQLQGISTDPFGSAMAGFGLRVPPVLPGVDQNAMPRYLFCLATRVLGNHKYTIRGMRAGAALGIDVSGTDNRNLIYELPITTPMWRFPDGNISYHLVAEPNDGININHSDEMFKETTSFKYLQSDGPAMLFNSCTYSAGNFNPQSGAPLLYPVGLTDYTPPDGNVLASRWTPVAGLGNMKGIFYDWDPHSDNQLNVPVSGNRKVSLYASVLQSNPATRLKARTLTATNVISNGIAPEDAFIQNFTTGEGGTSSPIYWRVYGSILWDDDFGAT